MGKLDAFLTIEKYNENGMHAENIIKKPTVEITWYTNKKECSKYSVFTLQTPQATVHSSLVADAWLAWHSMHKSIMWFRQMAQLSTTMSVWKNKKQINNLFWYNRLKKKHTPSP